MAANNILPFAQGVGAAVLSQAAYAAIADRTNGNQPGLASQQLVNKALLQLSAVAAGVAQFIADRQATAVDDSLTAAALATMLSAAVRENAVALLATGGTATAYTLTPTVPITAYEAGQSFLVNVGIAAGVSPTLNISGLGATLSLMYRKSDGTLANISGNMPPSVYRFTLVSAVQVLVEAVRPAGLLINEQVFPTVGTFTYTPTPGTAAIEIELVGGGGGGGGCLATGAGQLAAGAGGAAGGYAKSYLTTGFSGLSVVVGAGGTATAGAAGGAGGSTSFGALLSATGGGGATAGSVVTTGTITFVQGPNGGAGAGGNVLNAIGMAGHRSLYASGAAAGGFGGSSAFGAGGNGTGNTQAGTNATSPGAGGSGACTLPSGIALIGGTGAGGRVIIREYAA